MPSFSEKLHAETFIGSILRLPLALLPRFVVLPVLKGLNRGFRWKTGASTHGCWLGTYETDKQAAVQKLVRPGMNVFDIGANAGFYTLAFSRLVGEKGHVWAFEPFASNSSNILFHMKKNNRNNITLIQAGVGKGLTLSSFITGENNATGRLGDAGSYLIPVFSLDDLIDKYEITIPDLIKMDVEGAESQVLEGARTVLEKRQTVILIALHGNDQKQSCEKILIDSGYRIFSLDGKAVSRIDSAIDEIYAIPAEMT